MALEIRFDSSFVIQGIIFMLYTDFLVNYVPGENIRFKLV